MNELSSPSNRAGGGHWLRRTFSEHSTTLPRMGALALLVVCTLVLVLSARATSRPGQLGLRCSSCGSAVCVSWVMPAGYAWHEGARPGMPVVSVDGTAVVSSRDRFPTMKSAREAELQARDGTVFPVRVVSGLIGESPMKYSLWALGGMYAILGAAVFLRRPDSHVARVFVLFSGVTAVALITGPAAGGKHPPWALIVQFVSLVGIGVTVVGFALALVGAARAIHGRVVFLGFFGAALVLLVGYAASVVAWSPWYEWVRKGVGLYLVGSFLYAMGLFAAKGLRQDQPANRRAVWITLAGIGIGTLPFLFLTLLPEALLRHSFAPSHITVLFWGSIPLAITVAILQYRFFGIRRLLHRGIVYGTATVTLLVIVALAAAASRSLLGRAVGQSAWFLAGLIVLSVLAFYGLRYGALSLTNRILYRDPSDYNFVVEAMRSDLVSRPTQQVAKTILQNVADALHLESAVLFLGPEPMTAALVAAVGERSTAIVEECYPHIRSLLGDVGDEPSVELRWRSNPILVTPLRLSGIYLGHVVWGPKSDGEVFGPAERSLIRLVVPPLALVIDKSALSEELRELNRRLVQAGELERTRIAHDLHDGPLQRAILLGRHLPPDTAEQLEGPARRLVVELREICARLRPAVLDDLGLVAALEWLLEDMAGRAAIRPHLTVQSVHEDERFPPDLELALFRVTQEAVTNAVKHASASQLEVSLSRENGAVVLEIVDNGVGFSPHLGGSRGFGLSGMRERITQLNGSFHVASRPGSGTRVMARVPLE